jgi:hypothetical protein
MIEKGGGGLQTFTMEVVKSLVVVQVEILRADVMQLTKRLNAMESGSSETQLKV